MKKSLLAAAVVNGQNKGPMSMSYDISIQQQHAQKGQQASSLNNRKTLTNFQSKPLQSLRPT